MILHLGAKIIIYLECNDCKMIKEVTINLWYFCGVFPFSVYVALQFSNYLSLAKEVMFSVALVCLFVCLSVDNITQKVMNGLR